MTHMADVGAIIQKLHGALATQRESVPVREVWNGQTVWEGIVEVFYLHGHPDANTADAWVARNRRPTQT